MSSASCIRRGQLYSQRAGYTFYVFTNDTDDSTSWQYLKTAHGLKPGLETRACVYGTSASPELLVVTLEAIDDKWCGWLDTVTLFMAKAVLAVVMYLGKVVKGIVPGWCKNTTRKWRTQLRQLRRQFHPKRNIRQWNWPSLYVSFNRTSGENWAKF